MTVLYEEKSHRLLVPSYFRIYDDRVESYFFPYKYEIPFPDIEKVKIIEKIPWYVGWGLRIDLFNKRLFFAIHHGRSILIKRKSGFWKEIILSVKDPQKFISYIKPLIT
ncbi:MAG: hypothetical protein ACP5OK_01455 [Thermoprotei archaeon]|jgi:hypothetical protein